MTCSRLFVCVYGSCTWVVHFPVFCPYALVRSSDYVCVYSVYAYDWARSLFMFLFTISMPIPRLSTLLIAFVLSMLASGLSAFLFISTMFMLMLRSVVFSSMSVIFVPIPRFSIFPSLLSISTISKILPKLSILSSLSIMLIFGSRLSPSLFRI